MMMATSQGTGVSDTYTFVASGLADTIFIEESSTTPGSGWIHGTSGNVAIDETFSNYGTVVVQTGNAVDTVAVKSLLNVNGLQNLSIQTGTGGDTVDLSGADPSSALTVSVDGGAGTDDRLIGFNRDTAWQVTGVDSGRLGNATYSNVELYQEMSSVIVDSAVSNSAANVLSARQQYHGLTIAVRDGVAELQKRAADLGAAISEEPSLKVVLPLVNKSLKGVLDAGATMNQVLGAAKAVSDSMSSHDTAVDTLTISGTGMIVLGDGVSYAALPATANASQIQAALSQFASIGSGNVTVTSGANGFEIARAGNLPALPVLTAFEDARATVSSPLIGNGTQSLTLNVPGKSGAYILSVGNDSVVLPFNANAATIQSDLPP